MTEDNWKHRSEHMVCGTCMWFLEKRGHTLPTDNSHPGEVVEIFGRCRRHAPTMGGFPVVFGRDWCGDHKLDENKVSKL